MTKRLFTIGYQGSSAARLFEVLLANEVQILLDVRLRPVSRKPGLSKRSLEEKSSSMGIVYRHDSRLGTPSDLMHRMRAVGGYDRQIFEEFRTRLLAAVPEAIEAAAFESSGSNVCLLCYEADVRECHRLVVAEEICRRTTLEVSHLRLEDSESMSNLCEFRRTAVKPCQTSPLPV